MNDDRKDEGQHQPGPWQANFARLPPRESTVHSYAITPRAAELERGRKLPLLENGREVGGGNFPLAPSERCYLKPVAERAALGVPLP